MLNFHRFFLLISLLVLNMETGFSAGKKSELNSQGAQNEAQVFYKTPRVLNLVCPLCVEQSVDTVFLPCGHATACYSCSLKVQNCPQCRKSVGQRRHPVSFDFDFESVAQSVQEVSSDFDLICKNCRNNNIDILHLSCSHIGLCHDCALDLKICPHCGKKISRKNMKHVYIHFISEVRSGELVSPERIDSGYLGLTERARFQDFIDQVRPTANLLAGIKEHSEQADLSIRSGQEVVVRAQVSVLVACGLELSVGKYTTRRFRGVPYLRIGYVLGGGFPGSATVAFSFRQYSQRSESPSADFSVAGTHDAQLTAAFGIGIARHELAESEGSMVDSSIHERGMSVGLYGSFMEYGGRIIQVPVCFSSQIFSRKGRLFMRAKNLEKRLVSSIRMGDWRSVYERILPDYQATTSELLARVNSRNRIQPVIDAIHEDHPFYSVENLMHAVGRIEEL